MRRLLRPSFGQAGGGGRLGGLLPTLGAGTTVQLLSTVASFVTIPITVRALGSSSFGILVVVVSLAPWLFLVDGALQSTTRLLVGESRAGRRNTASAELLHSTARLAFKVAAVNFLVLGVALLVLPLVALFGADGVATGQELALAMLTFAVPVILSAPGGVYLGALEGVGRTVAAVVISGIGPLFALPATILVVASGGGLIGLCAVQGLSVAAPRYAAWVYWRMRPSADEPADTQVATPRLGFGLIFQMVVLGAAVYVQSGLDPVIVSSQLDAAAAGSFGLAARLVGGALIPLAVITPLLAGNISAARGSGWSAGSNSELRRLLAQCALAGGALAALLVMLGPWLAGILGAGKVSTPLDLYVASGAFVFVSFVVAPLSLAFMGPRGLRRSLYLNLALLIANISVSVVLARHIGPAGPMWASAGAGLVAIAHWVMVWVRHPEWLAESHPRSDPIEAAVEKGDAPDASTA